MSMKEDLAYKDQTIAKLSDRLDEVSEKLRIADDEVRHWRAAAAAVKWLWEQVQKQQPFQL